VRVRYRDRPRSDKELSHPSPVAIEMRWKTPLLPRRRDPPLIAAPKRRKLPAMTVLDPAE